MELQGAEDPVRGGLQRSNGSSELTGDPQVKGSTARLNQERSSAPGRQQVAKLPGVTATDLNGAEAQLRCSIW